MCVCVCKRERERARARAWKKERERQRGDEKEWGRREGEREIECMFKCMRERVCVRVRL